MMKRYIRSSESLEAGSYMLSKQGRFIPVFFHAPSTTYEGRKIHHLCPTDADFLMKEGKISGDDAEIIVMYCLLEYLESEGISDNNHEITDKDIDGFASYADLKAVPQLYVTAYSAEGYTISEIEKAVKGFNGLTNKWYDWLKNNYVKVTVHGNVVEFRIGSNNNFDWNKVIIDKGILGSGLSDNKSLRYNILRESNKGYKAYFQDATLNDLLENDDEVLSTENVSIEGSSYTNGAYSNYKVVSWDDPYEENPQYFDTYVEAVQYGDRTYGSRYDIFEL